MIKKKRRNSINDHINLIKYGKVNQSIHYYIDYDIQIMFEKKKILIYIIFDIKVDTLLDFAFKITFFYSKHLETLILR